MHAPRSSPDHDARLQGREAQSRGWSAPVPSIQTFGAPVVRQRLEWETRDTINNRLWADTMEAGPKAVTTAMLAEHVSQGAMTMNPSSSRHDDRPYHHQTPYFPDATGPLERPRLPAKSLFQNPWSAGYDIENGDITRELRGAVKEDNRFLSNDVSARMAGRTFEHQWIPPTVTRAIAERKIDAAEMLRPSHDDYRKTYLPSLTGTHFE